MSILHPEIEAILNTGATPTRFRTSLPLASSHGSLPPRSAASARGTEAIHSSNAVAQHLSTPQRAAS